MSDEVSDPSDPSVINKAEVVETLGNMFLVKIDGELKQVPATYKNKLLYEKELYELLHPETADERVILTDDTQDEEFLAIAPTNNDSVYQIWVDDYPYPVMNPPSMAEDVLRGVHEALEVPASYERLRSVYQKIRSTRVRRYVMDRAASMFPANEVIPTDEGWSILGLFVLTWDARVFLDTGEVEKQTSYSIRGGGVSETDQPREFLQLAIRDETIAQYRDLALKIHYPLAPEVDVTNSDTTVKECPTCGTDEPTYEYYDEHAEQPERPVFVCQKCDQPWQEFDLTEREVEFIAKAQWLINHRGHLDDDAFWDVVESFVWHVE